jgi:hypothetical protein
MLTRILLISAGFAILEGFAHASLWLIGAGGILLAASLLTAVIEFLSPPA